ncbi:hypothetical protein GPECTOR_681g818 [Gonium pectorale]|uniref:Uncharacterized protein n=1 Tax=Gonium pectorale TaxID=33097 RepID=A0A150FUC7_GONPE|nr:hypothetical protein GPECTOR_681g818 [Gonium pectorale]|eukprot:KXZ41178.1 hypothetical protein GPECTOR_681g818 [Gonium pectorale]
MSVIWRGALPVGTIVKETFREDRAFNCGRKGELRSEEEATRTASVMRAEREPRAVMKPELEAREPELAAMAAGGRGSCSCTVVTGV